VRLHPIDPQCLWLVCASKVYSGLGADIALFNECTQLCARIVLDMADIVRDGDLSPTEPRTRVQNFL
jgi:hypothetical protein